MEKALFYKEWLKTRSVFVASLIVAVAFAVYALLRMNRLTELKGVDHLWLIMLLKDNSFVDVLQYIPLAVGLAVGISQMSPEMIQKRLKLTLHLPYPQMKLVSLMLAVGVLELLVIYALQVTIVAAYDASILPRELVWRVLLTMMPWYLAGIAAYFFASAVCMEGTWRRRMVIILIGVVFLMTCFSADAMEAYNGYMPLLTVMTLLTAILSFGSVIRFKEGV